MNGIRAERINKISQGHPNVVDLMMEDAVDLVINTPSSRSPKKDEIAIRSKAIAFNIPLITTVSGAAAAVIAQETLMQEGIRVKALQDYHPSIR